jgi:hypothetical protein
MPLARQLSAAIATVVATAQLAFAQTPAGVTHQSAGVVRDAPRVLRSVSSAAAPNSGGAFFVEALGGSLGSLVGVGIVGLSAACGHEDLGCVIYTVGAGGIVGALGATIGTEVAARYTGSKRSVLGAALGAAVGTGVGLGIHALVNRNSDRNLGDPIVVPIFVIAQGTFAAIGSRMLGTAR